MFKTDVNLSVIDKYSGGKILSLRKDCGMEKYNQITIENILADKEEYCAYEDKLVIVRLRGEQRFVYSKIFQFKDTVSFLFTHTGTAKIQVNDVECTLTGNSIIDILDTDVVQNMYLNPVYEGTHVFMSVSFFYELLKNIPQKANEGLLNRMDFLYIELFPSESEVMLQAIRNLTFQISRKEHLDYHDLIKAFALVFFLEFRNIATSRRRIFKKKNINKEHVVANFTRLLAENCHRQHEVRWYANELCIDPVYLSRILKSVKGKTANQWIDEAIIRQAKMYLKDYNASIKDIAGELNFSDQAAFSKFFKKHDGRSPSDYRKELLLKNGR